MMQPKGSSPPMPALNPAALMGGGPATHAACAACSHQRKRCSDSCELAPYLPASRKVDFQDLQKVFGVSNLSKMLRNAGLHENRAAGDANRVADEALAHQNRMRATEAMIWEARKRQQDPVLGAYGDHQSFAQKEERYLREIKLLRQQLGFRLHGGDPGWSNGGGPVILNNDGLNVLAPQVPMNYGGGALMVGPNGGCLPYAQAPVSNGEQWGGVHPGWYAPNPISEYRTQ